jgi:hypothetical protein
VAASGQWLQVVSGCKWSAAASGQRLQVVSGCKWSVAASGQWLQVVSGCKWSVAASGQRLQVVSGCKWSVAASGQRLQVVSGCKWSVAASGQRLHEVILSSFCEPFERRGPRKTKCRGSLGRPRKGNSRAGPRTGGGSREKRKVPSSPAAGAKKPQPSRRRAVAPKLSVAAIDPAAQAKEAEDLRRLDLSAVPDVPNVGIPRSAA